VDLRGLLASLKKKVSDVGSFVQQNPTPAGFISGQLNARISGGIQGGVQRVLRGNNYNFYDQAARGNVPTFQSVKPVGQFIGNYVQNRYIQPIVDLPKNTRTLFSPKTSLPDRAMAGLGVMGGIATAFPDPIQDVAMPLVDYAKGVNASAIRGGKTLENVKSGLQAMSLEKPVGLGTATTTNPFGETIGNLAELPLTIGLTGKMTNKQNIGFDKKVIETARKGFTPEVKKMIKDFAYEVETSSSPNKKNLGQLGDYIHSLAGTIFGDKRVANMTNTQLKNLFDVLLYQVDNRAPMGRYYPVGLRTQNIREGMPDIKIGGTGYIPEEIVQKHDYDLIDAEVKRQLRQNYSVKDIDMFNRIKQMARAKDVQNGDVETIYKKNPKLLEMAFQTVKEQEPTIQTNDDAYQFILSLPTKRETMAGRAPKESFGVGDTVYNAEPVKPTVQQTQKVREQAMKAEFDAWQRSYRAQTLPATPNTQATGVAKQIQGATKSPTARNTEELKDISGFQGYMRDVYRNFKSVYGKRFDEAKRVILDPFDKSKGEYIKMNESWADKLKKEVVDKFNIQKGSKESAAVQLYGEKQIDQVELIKRFGEKKAGEIMQADAWFRKSYDELIDTINATRKKIYPNSPEKWIAKRQDYYRHFREMQEGIGALFNIFDSPSNISSNLSGTSEYMKPKSKFLSLAQKRMGIKTDVDAIGGFIDYIKQASYATHIDKHVDQFRALATELADSTGESKNLNNFIEYLQNFANDLSGKSNPADRFFQSFIPGGRTTFKAINWLNNRVKANAVIGNVSSALSQIMNVPQGIADAGPVNAVKGFGRTLAGMFIDNPVIKQSTFVRERLSDPFSQFDKGILDDAKKFATWMTGILDKVGTQYIWNSEYEKALSNGIPNAVKFADDATRALVAGRGIGEVPLLQKARVMQLFAPFQLEVQNLWFVMKDWVDEKSFGKLATFFVVNHVMNKGIESIRGSDVTFDPIQAMMDGYNSFTQEENKTRGAIKFAGRQVGEVLSNVPLGQNLATFYPEYGMEMGGTNMTRKDLFGKGNPVRQGSGILVAEGIKDPYKTLPPFGGAQIKKNIEGAKTLLQGYAGKESAVQYPVERTQSNIVRGLAFGKSALPETREYYDQNRRPLSEKQSSVVLEATDRKSNYQTILSNREENALDQKAIDQLKSSGESMLEKNSKLYILQNNGDVKTIDPSFQPTPPKLTGMTELDKKAISKYKGELTQKANDIYDLYQAGKISEKDAESQIKALQGLKTRYSTKKPKAIKIAKPKKIKITIPKIKTTKVKPLQQKKILYKIKRPKIKVKKLG